MQVKALFHETGHALNSVLCDNGLQHLFGARGPLDLVELPSHVLERAVLHGSVLQELLATSSVDRHGPSQKAIEEYSEALLLRERFCKSLANAHSLLLPRADALLHGTSPPGSTEELQQAYHHMLVSHLPMAVPSGLFPHLSLHHVVSYGGFCHAYAVAEAVADLVWEEHLDGHELQTGIGAELAEVLFRKGGAVDVQAALQQLLPKHMSTAQGIVRKLVTA
jgi:mitochondrial intermediate peptidase